MINFYKVTVFLVVLVLEPVFAADECQNLQEALQSSEKLMSQNDYQMAADLLDDILSKCKTESTTLAEVLSYRGGISNRMGKYEKAIYFQSTALTIAKKNPENNAELIGEILYKLGDNTTDSGDIENGERLLNESIAILEQSNSDSEILANAYNAFAQNRNMAGNYSEANQLYEQTLKIIESLYSDNHPEYAEILGNYAMNLDDLGKYPEAERSHRKALAVFEQHYLEKQDNIAITSNNLGINLQDQGKHEEAILFLESALEITKLLYPGDSEGTATTIFNLAVGYYRLENFFKAEKMFWEASLMLERILGSDHWMTALALQGVSLMYRKQDKFKESAKLNQRILKVYESTFEPDNNRFGDLYSHLTVDYEHENNMEQAEYYLREALRIHALNRGMDDRTVTSDIALLAEFLDRQGRFTESAKLHKQSIEITSNLKGNHHIELSNRHVGLSKHYLMQNLINPAIMEAEKALEIIEKEANIEITLLRAKILGHLSRTYAENGQLKKALGISNDSSEYFKTYLIQNDSSNIPRLIREFKQQKKHYQGQATWSFKLGMKGEIDHYATSFETSQLAKISPAAFAINRMNVRNKIGQGNSALVRQYQDLIENRSLLQIQLDNFTLKTGLDAQEKNKVRKEIQSLNLLVLRMAKQLKQNTPISNNSIIPIPTKIIEIQRQLKREQLFLNFMFTADELIVWGIKKDKVHAYFVRNSKSNLETSTLEIRKAVLDYRNQLSENFFDESFNLYNRLIGPVVRELGGANELIIVPDGILHALPFATLITEPVTKDQTSDIPWLIRQSSISILPSVSAFKSLGGEDQNRHSLNSFVGIGDPILEGEILLSDLFSKRGDLSQDEIRQLPALPETRSELEQISSHITSQSKTFLFGEKATDKGILSLNLGETDLIAFATHAVNAKTEFGMEEAGLVMSGLGSDNIDDWLLSSSEIRQLKLNTSLIILSACNTASIGSDGQNAYSGLAESFFYAGAKSLLVSQWPVASNEIVHLSTTMLSNYIANQSISKAEALRRSMIAMIDGTNTSYQHPFFWAPFVLVGVN